MRKCSREIIFIHTARPGERAQLLKPINEIKELDDDSEEIHSTGLLNWYMRRPASLENVSLADWAAWFDSRTKPFITKSQNIDTDKLSLETLDNDENNDDELLDTAKENVQGQEKTKAKKRSKPRITRSVWFSINTDPEKHYRE